MANEVVRRAGGGGRKYNCRIEGCQLRASPNDATIFIWDCGRPSTQHSKESKKPYMCIDPSCLGGCALPLCTSKPTIIHKESEFPSLCSVGKFGSGGSQHYDLFFQDLCDFTSKVKVPVTTCSCCCTPRKGSVAVIEAVYEGWQETDITSLARFAGGHPMRRVEGQQVSNAADACLVKSTFDGRKAAALLIQRFYLKRRRARLLEMVAATLMVPANAAFVAQRQREGAALPEILPGTSLWAVYANHVRYPAEFKKHEASPKRARHI